MSAFKVLNLKKFSTRIIFILFFLSLGLSALLFSGNRTDFLAYGPSPLFGKYLTVFWIFMYAILGNILYEAYCLKIKKATPTFFAILSSTLLSMLWQITLFKYRLCLISLFILLFSLTVCIFAMKNLFPFRKSAFFLLAICSVLILYSLYFNLLCF